MDRQITRRQFLRLNPLDVVKMSKGTEGGARALLIRPPGALKDEEQFLAACERCSRCSEACPFDVISHLGPAAGAGEGTPYLDPEAVPCHWCADMPCIRACPSGALSFNDAGEAEPIAKAELDLGACLTQQGILCDDCATVCPSNIRAITMENRVPHLNRERCVGCGLCAYHCAATPTAIRVKDRIRNSSSHS